ncbi:hypothetical protein VB005_08017 [Metarhizium brunneum]
MALNEQQVLKLAKEKPEEFVAWAEGDIVNQPLKETVMAAVRNVRPHVTTGQVMSLLHDMRSEVYQEKLRELTPPVTILGRPFVEFKMMEKLCRMLGISMWWMTERYCPAQTTEPADIVYSTMYLKAQEATKARLVEKFQRFKLEREARESSQPAAKPVTKPSAPGDLGKSRWAPNTEAAAGPAPKDDSGVASGKSSKDTAATKPAAPSAGGKGKAREMDPSEEALRSAWKSIMGSEAPPSWPAWPGFPHHEFGTFDIPFPPERDWEACYGRPGRDLRLYVSPAVQVDCHVYGEGFRKLVVRLRDQQAATPFNHMELFRSWAGLAAWANQLAKGNQDIPITDFMKNYLRVSVKCAFTMISGED